MFRSASLLAPLMGFALALTSACGSGPEQEDAGGDACEVGFALSSQIQDELSSVPATCKSAEDCTSLNFTLDCAGNRIGGCGIILHRDVAAQFDPGEANARFCASIRPSEYGCIASPSCAALTLACEAGRCVGVPR